jgi:hypothetical protein
MGLAKGSKTIERYTHIDDLEVHNGYLKARGLEVKTVKEEDPTILEPKKCFRCNTMNPVDSKYCYSCNMVLDYREVERKLDILELFNSKFMKEFGGIDTEKIMREYKHFRAETNDLSNLLDCFNGSDEVSIPEVRRRLDLKDNDALNLLQYLMTGGFIEIKMDTVKLLDKEKFSNYILMQKRYLEN